MILQPPLGSRCQGEMTEEAWIVECLVGNPPAFAEPNKEVVDFVMSL